MNTSLHDLSTHCNSCIWKSECV